MRESASQLRFDCGGFVGGTSGGPWLANYDPRTGTGEVVGVIGGFERGGFTPDRSYSAFLDSTARRLHDQAE